MAMHSGKTYSSGDVSLRAPDYGAVEACNRGNPEDAEWREWRERAATHEDIYYFAIYLNDRLVGEIFLHDIDRDSREALLGYRIFSETDRGKGFGSQALHLLQDFVVDETTLVRLVIMTGEENMPSRSIAARCGFASIGAAREDPQLVVFDWKSPTAQ